jgi:thioredoxin-related protein
VTALLCAALVVAAVQDYDPKRDAEKDIREAVGEAARSGRRVLLEVGGQWCGWCRRLDKVFADHRELTELRDKHYVLVKVNFSPENENRKVLSKYPKIEGYPHIFVLDAQGRLVHSQNTGELEEGRDYNIRRIRVFLEAFAP